MLRTVATSLLALAAASASAAEDDFLIEEGLPWVDIRLGYGFVPHPKEYDTHAALYTGVDVDYTFTVDDDTAQALSYTIVGGSMNPLGLIGGAELVYTWDSMRVTEVSSGGITVGAPSPGSELTYRTFGGNVLLGLGLALGDSFHLEALGLAGIAAVSMDTTDPAFRHTDGGGWLWTAGVRGGAYFTWRHLVIGAAVEWTVIDVDFEANWANANTSTEEHVSGLGGRVEIGYHIQ